MALNASLLLCAAAAGFLQNILAYSWIYNKKIVLLNSRGDEALGFWIVGIVGTLFAIIAVIKGADDNRTASSRILVGFTSLVGAVAFPAILSALTRVLGSIEAGSFLFGPMLIGFAAAQGIQTRGSSGSGDSQDDVSERREA